MRCTLTRGTMRGNKEPFERKDLAWLGTNALSAVTSTTSRKKAQAGRPCSTTGRAPSVELPTAEFELVGGELHQEAGQSATVNPVSPFGGAALAHRVFGYVFRAIPATFIIQMVPRPWTYQIYFLVQTVVHITHSGRRFGALLILKITIVRFFRRLDQTLVPSLGTAVLVASVVLIGFLVPAAFREAFATRSLFADENRERVRTLLTEISSEELDEAECTRLASKGSLCVGQRVLRQECVDCHDLRTVLAKPRTPENWRQTVRRMADRTTDHQSDRRKRAVAGHRPLSCAVAATTEIDAATTERAGTTR